MQSQPTRYTSNDTGHIWGRNYVYILWCPLSKQVKYVGYSTMPPRIRLQNHQSEARNLSNHGRAKSRWIYSLLEQATSPVLRVVKYFDTQYEAIVYEAELIKSIGLRRPLLNGNKGELGLIASYRSRLNA